MKVCTYEGAKDKQVIANEVGLMLLNGGESIMRCHEVFDFKKRLWIIIDLMNSNLSDFIDEM